MMRSNQEAKSLLQNFITLIETHGTSAKCLQTDNGLKVDMRSFFHSTKHQINCVETPQ